jgi:hypothetical protein
MGQLEQAVEQRFAEVRDSLLKIGTVSGTSGTKVIVAVEGASMTLPVLTSYTPVVGHVVYILALKPGSWFVLGKPA